MCVCARARVRVHVCVCVCVRADKIPSLRSCKIGWGIPASGEDSETVLCRLYSVSILHIRVCAHLVWAFVTAKNVTKLNGEVFYGVRSLNYRNVL
jgi:hypothetical protein